MQDFPTFFYNQRQCSLLQIYFYMLGQAVNFRNFSPITAYNIVNQPKNRYFMEIRRPTSASLITGRIINIDRQNWTFTTISDGNPASSVRFNVTPGTRIFDLFGRSISFSQLIPGLRVQINHTPVMTASIPPQTTALVIRIIR